MGLVNAYSIFVQECQNAGALFFFYFYILDVIEDCIPHCMPRIYLRNRDWSANRSCRVYTRLCYLSKGVSCFRGHFWIHNPVAWRNITLVLKHWNQNGIGNLPDYYPTVWAWDAYNILHHYSDEMLSQPPPVILPSTSLTHTHTHTHTHRYFWRVTVQCVLRLIWSVVFVMSSTKRTGVEIMSAVLRVPLFSEFSVICNCSTATKFEFVV